MQKQPDVERAFHIYLLNEQRVACMSLRGPLIREDAIGKLDQTNLCFACLCELRERQQQMTKAQA